MERHLFILNPAAGTRDRTAKMAEIVEKLKLDAPYDIYVTDAKGAAETYTEGYLREHGESFVRIYACGGDGTLCEVANGMYRSGSKNCAVAVVPIGSGNDFVKSLDIPPERFRDLKTLVRGEIKEVDLLLASDSDGQTRVSLNIISAGFDAAVANGQERFKRLPLVSGKTAYNLSLVKCVFTDTKNYFSLKVDGEKYGKSDEHHHTERRVYLREDTAYAFFTLTVQDVRGYSQKLKRHQQSRKSEGQIKEEREILLRHGYFT
jgi:diacylglycerol kinase family enzyme